MDNKTVVIYLEYMKDPGKASPLIADIIGKLDSRPVVVSSNFNTDMLKRGNPGPEVYYADDLITFQDNDFMDKYVLGVTTGWYKKLPKSVGMNSYNGIEFGNIYEDKVQRYLSYNIKNFEIILKITERFNPSMIIFVGNKDTFGNLPLFASGALNIPARFVEAADKSSAARFLAGKIKENISSITASLFDNLLAAWLINRRKKTDIFADSRLYHELGDLKEKFSFCQFIISKGLKLRLTLLFSKKTCFIPVMSEGFFKAPAFLNPFSSYWKKAVISPGFKEVFGYKGISIYRPLEGFLKGVVTHDFANAKKNIIRLGKLYNVIRPKLVILREAVRVSERIIVFTARRSAVKTLVIQHGILAEKHIFTKLYCDKIAVWGKATVDWYGCYGNDISKCEITGNPRHDIICSDERDDSRTRARLSDIGIDPDKDLILFIPVFFKSPGFTAYSVHYYTPDMEHLALREILEVAKYFPDKQIVIKLHPFDYIDEKHIRDAYGLYRYGNVFVVKDIDITLLIKASSLAVTSFFSTAALDAVMLGKPVICMNFYKMEDPVPFVSRGVALGVTKKGELLDAVKKIFMDKEINKALAGNRPGFIYDYAYKTDGKSAQRVTELIDRLCV